MLINLTNHPSDRWSEVQRQAALSMFGEVRDWTFPNIHPEWHHEEVHDLAWTYVQELSGVFAASRQEHVVACPLDGVHLMGETSFVVAFARYWRDATEDDESGEQAIGLYASTTQREVVVHPDGSKTSQFTFVRFRRM